MALPSLSGALALVRSVADRLDGWVNPNTGFGTSRDKTQGAFFAPGCFLTATELAWLYTFDDLAAKVVETFPKEEMRVGFGLKGLDDAVIPEATKYLNRFDILCKFTEGRIWGNLFGGSSIWVMVDDGLDPQEPLDVTKIRTVLDLRVIDMRWHFPETYYQDGAQVGQPEIYRIVEPHAGGTGATIGLIHESRLIRFPGDRTEHLAKIGLRMWDYSVLVRAHEALRSCGAVWRAAELLVCDSNQAVWKIKDLYKMIAADTKAADDFSDGGAALKTTGPTPLIFKRVAILDKLRSVARAIVLDSDGEDFQRQTTNFTGLADMTDRGWKRLAAASGIPYTRLTGEAPAGLNATGDQTERAFLATCEANQKQIDEPRLLRLLRILFSAQDAPAGLRVTTPKADADPSSEEQGAVGKPEDDPLDDLALVWLPLWAPSATELAEIRLKYAQEAQILVQEQIVLPEEAAKNLPEDWWPTVDREARDAVLANDTEALVKQRSEAQLNPPPPAPAPGAPPKPGQPKPPEPSNPNAPPEPAQK